MLTYIRARQIGISGRIGCGADIPEQCGLQLRIGYGVFRDIACAERAFVKRLALDFSSAHFDVYGDVICYQTVEILNAIIHGGKERSRRARRAGVVEKVYLHR